MVLTAANNHISWVHVHSFWSGSRLLSVDVLSCTGVASTSIVVVCVYVCVCVYVVQGESISHKGVKMPMHDHNLKLTPY